MADPLSRNPLDPGDQPALMAPRSAPSNSVLQMVAADAMRGDPVEQDNNPKGYPEFVNDQMLYQTIIAGYALDPWFSNPHNLKHFVYENHIWWHEKAVVVRMCLSKDRISCHFCSVNFMTQCIAVM